MFLWQPPPHSGSLPFASSSAFAPSTHRFIPASPRSKLSGRVCFFGRPQAHPFGCPCVLPELSIRIGPLALPLFFPPFTFFLFFPIKLPPQAHLTPLQTQVFFPLGWFFLPPDSLPGGAPRPSPPRLSRQQLGLVLGPITVHTKNAAAVSPDSPGIPIFSPYLGFRPPSRLQLSFGFSSLFSSYSFCCFFFSLSVPLVPPP